MDLLELLLILFVPLLAFGGLVIAVYLLIAVGRGVSSILPRTEAEEPDRDAVDLREPRWEHDEEPDEPFPAVEALTARDQPDAAVSEPTHRIQVIAQVLFTHVRHDGIFVDTVVLEALGAADGVLRLGAPLSLRVERSGPEILGACSEALLELWAERGEVVAVDLCVRGEDVRAELSNGSSRVVLEISEAAGFA